MNKENELLIYIKENGFVSVQQICDNFYISQSTVRRELAKLDEKGFIDRMRGGAKIKDSNNSVFNFSLRIHQNALEKKLIALKAIKLIKEGDVVFLDGSTSTYFLAEYLNEFKNITVITNGIDTLSLLAKNKVNSMSTGGIVSKENTSVLIGQQTIDFVKKINANICFFSCQSLDKQGIISDCYLEENNVRLEMIKQSDKSYFLCDSGKLNRKSPHVLSEINNIGLISEKPLDNYFDKNIACDIIS